MAYLTDDKRSLVLVCKQCGGEVRYATGWPAVNPVIKDQLESILKNWQENAETCGACLSGPTRGTADVEPHVETGTADVPAGPAPVTTAPLPAEVGSYWTYRVPPGPHIAPPPPVIQDHHIPELLGVKQLQVILELSRGRVLRMIREELMPTGGVVRVGNRYKVHTWALNHVLSQRVMKPRPKQVYSPARLAALKAGKLKLSMKKSRSTSFVKPSSSSGEKSSI